MGTRDQVVMGTWCWAEAVRKPLCSASASTAPFSTSSQFVTVSLAHRPALLLANGLFPITASGH